MTKAISFLLFLLSVVPLFGQTGFEGIDSTSQKVPKVILDTGGYL